MATGLDLKFIQAVQSYELNFCIFAITANGFCKSYLIIGPSSTGFDTILFEKSTFSTAFRKFHSDSAFVESSIIFLIVRLCESIIVSLHFSISPAL